MTLACIVAIGIGVETLARLKGFFTERGLGLITPMMCLALLPRSILQASSLRILLAATTVAGVRFAWASWRRGITVGKSSTAEPPKDHLVRVVVLAGPTAIGKSSVAMRLCGALRGEVVSADSVQLYKGLDIGSNKPDMKMRAMVSHHLVDVADATDPWTAGRWSRAAMEAIEDCHARKRTPVVVGGTMLYVRWLTRGAPDAPAASARSAARAEDMLRVHRDAGRWDEGVSVLAMRSKRAAARASEISPNDWYRLSRALEIELETGGLTQGPESVELFLADKSRYDARCFFLAPTDRAELFRAIDDRCDAMLEAGLLTEVANLVATSKLPLTSTAARAIGYRQSLEYFDRRLRGDNEHDQANLFVDFCRDFATASRNYAANQIKWYRRDNNFAIVPANAGALDSILAAFALPRPDYDTWLGSPNQQVSRGNLVADKRQMKRFASRLPKAATDLTYRARQLDVADAALDRIKPILADSATHARDNEGLMPRSHTPTLRPSIFSLDGRSASNRLESLRRLQRDGADEDQCSNM